MLSFLYSPTLTSIHDYCIALNRQTFVGKVMFLLFNMLSRLVIAFLPRNKCLLIPKSLAKTPEIPPSNFCCSMRLRTSSLTKQHRNVPYMMPVLFYLAFVVWLTGLVFVLFFLQIWLGYGINSQPGMSKFGPNVSL